MYTHTTASLTGINQVNDINLTGRSFICEKLQEPYYIVRLKKIIFDRFITPLFTKNWNIIEKNVFSISAIKQKLEKYIFKDGFDDLQVYLSLLNVVIEILGEHNHFENLEKLYHPKDTVATIKFKIPKIRLKPQYELYKLIIGKPKKFKDYDDRVLKYIEGQLQTEFIPFDTIRDNCRKEFKLP